MLRRLEMAEGWDPQQTTTARDRWSTELQGELKSQFGRLQRVWNPTHWLERDVTVCHAGTKTEWKISSLVLEHHSEYSARALKTDMKEGHMRCVTLSEVPVGALEMASSTTLEKFLSMQSSIHADPNLPCPDSFFRTWKVAPGRSGKKGSARSPPATTSISPDSRTC